MFSWASHRPTPVEENYQNFLIHFGECRYGGVYPGVGWVIWRSWDYLPDDLVQSVSYLGTPQTSMTLNFSRNAMQVVLQYYNVSCNFKDIPTECHIHRTVSDRTKFVRKPW